MAYNDAQKESMQLRFAEGDRVQCNIGEWVQGTITQVWYRENDWAADKWAPYQVQLDQGSLIYAPVDDDRAVKVAPEGPEPQPPKHPHADTCAAP